MERAGATVRTADLGQDLAADAIDATDAVVLDCRHGWTAAAGKVLGAAEAKAVPVLAIVEVVDDNTAPPLGATSRSLALDVDLNSKSSVDVSAERLCKDLKELLRPHVAAGPALRGVSDRHDPAHATREEAVFARTDAEDLIAALLLDGLTASAIADELERRGAPQSWVRSRLVPRPGW